MKLTQTNKQTNMLVQLETAFVHIKKCRYHYRAGDTIWDLCTAWERVRHELLVALETGFYGFTQPISVRTRDQAVVTVTCAKDAVLLKALALMLTKTLRNSGIGLKLAHMRGNGGGKKAIRQIHHILADSKHTGFIYKTDIADYYASIPHAQLYAAVRALWKHPPRWVNLIYAAIKAGLYKDGHYYDAQAQGILKGSPLSYVLGSFYLHLVDKVFQNNPAVRYIRYIDDIIIFTKTRSMLKKVIQRTYQVLDNLQLKVSHAKTYAGKISKGFSFLGYRFEPNRKVTVRPETVSKSLERVDRLLEQGRLTKERLEKHVKGFITWARGGLSGLVDAEQTRETFVDPLLTAGVYRRLAPPIKHTYDKGEKVWLKKSVKLSRWHAWL